MERDFSIFGARADIRLKYLGDINALANILSEELVHVPFEIEVRESPPHDLVGMCEALGFEVWLENVKEKENTFRLRIESSHSLEESFNDQMYDLSLWLARYIFEICKIHAFVNLEDGTEVKFVS